jgi:hypothetical protein
MRGNIIAHVQTEPSVNTEHEYRLVGECVWKPTGYVVPITLNRWFYVSCGVGGSQAVEADGDYCQHCGDFIRVEA